MNNILLVEKAKQEKYGYMCLCERVTTATFNEAVSSSQFTSYDDKEEKEHVNKLRKLLLKAKPLGLMTGPKKLN